MSPPRPIKDRLMERIIPNGPRCWTWRGIINCDLAARRMQQQSLLV